jgi:hypothetical protein
MFEISKRGGGSMNKLHIYTTESVLKWIKDMPEHPLTNDIKGDDPMSCQTYARNLMRQYNEALSKAKREAVTFEDQEFVSFLIRTNPIGTELIPDKIYSIDYKGRVEIINSRFAKDDLPVGIPVARLIPESTEVKPMQVREDMICPVTKQHCDDECCPVGAICNLSSDSLISSPESTEVESQEEMPIKLKHMALTYDQWLLIVNTTVNNGSIEAATIHRDKSTITGDLLHSKSTIENIMERRAVDLTCRLLRDGVKITFMDGVISERVIESISPPLYDKYFRK